MKKAGNRDPLEFADSDLDESDDSVELPTVVSTGPSVQHANQYGIGADLMAKMGYRTGYGLGKDGTGIVEPVSHTDQVGKAGLGMNALQKEESRIEPPSQSTLTPAEKLEIVNNRRIELLEHKKDRLVNELGVLRSKSDVLVSILHDIQQPHIDLELLYANYGEYWDEFHLDEVVSSELARLMAELEFNDPQVFDLIENSSYMQSDESLSNVLALSWIPKLENQINSNNWEVTSEQLLEFLTQYDAILLPIHKQLDRIIGTALLNNADSLENMISWMSYFHSSSSVVARARAEMSQYNQQTIADPEALAKAKRWIPFTGMTPGFTRAVAKYLDRLDPGTVSAKSPLSSLLNAWQSLLGPNRLAALLLPQFADKWSKCLLLLTKSDNWMENLYEWYNLWKEIFPQALIDSEDFQPYWIYFMDVINTLLDSGSYSGSLPLPAMPKPKSKATEIHSTFRDVLEDFCAKHSLSVRPSWGANVSGNYEYEIGRPGFELKKILCYIDEDVLWIRSHQKFEPISLDELSTKV